LIWIDYITKIVLGEKVPVFVEENSKSKSKKHKDQQDFDKKTLLKNREIVELASQKLLTFVNKNYILSGKSFDDKKLDLKADNIFGIVPENFTSEVCVNCGQESKNIIGEKFFDDINKQKYNNLITEKEVKKKQKQYGYFVRNYKCSNCGFGIKSTNNLGQENITEILDAINVARYGIIIKECQDKDKLLSKENGKKPYYLKWYSEQVQKYGSNWSSEIKKLSEK
jgi:hypothetical protein